MTSQAPLPPNTPDAQFFNPPNLLKLKVGEGRIDPEALQRAERAVTSLAKDYLDWAAEDATRLEAALRAAEAQDADRAGALHQLFMLAHDMKGQGGTFGYPLVSRIGDSLCRLIERAGGEANLQVVAAHVEAIRAVLANRVEGDDDATGRQIAEGLEAAAAA